MFLGENNLVLGFGSSNTAADDLDDRRKRRMMRRRRIKAAAPENTPIRMYHFFAEDLLLHGASGSPHKPLFPKQKFPDLIKAELKGKK